MSLSGLFRTLRTVRHLRLSQIVWRLRYRHRRGRPAIAHKIPGQLMVRRTFPDVPTDSLYDPCDPDLVNRLREGKLRLLGDTRSLIDSNQVDWCLGEMNENRLWTITLHYHRWAWELARVVKEGGPERDEASALLRRLLGDWITRADLSARGARDLAWNSYAIATRIGWWCRLWHLLGEEGRTDWGPLETIFLESLFTQAAWLESNIEWDLRANHLLRDAVGLVWAGRFFEGPRAARWLREGTRIALEQTREQVLPDGGHFERSPMYHVEVMEDFLNLSFLMEDMGASLRMEHIWNKMARFLVWVRHPDGQVPLLNDGGFNGAATPEAMLRLGNRHFAPALDDRLPEWGRFFPQFGLVTWHDRRWSLFFDVGEVGVDYQPGHAHADTLSIEASFAGRRLFVDPGTFSYDNDPRRHADRSTASHNTISIDQTNSSEVWHIFRVGRRARPEQINVKLDKDHFTATAAHNGYRRLTGLVTPKRKVSISPEGILSIQDQIDGRGKHQIEGGLLLGPDFKAEPQDSGWLVTDGENHLAVDFITDAPEAWQLSIEPAVYHPEYGLELETVRLCYKADRPLPCQIEIQVKPIEI
jgi:uncharacterized heparinase superfamily protein